MKKMMKKTDIQQPSITRKEALQKAGKYAAFTAATMMMLLPQKAASAQSAPPPPPNDPW
jgi:formiminotetrahydrofolate cyclodeaminase